MTQVILFKQDNGIPAIIIPTSEALDLYGVDIIAKKDVPFGKPYKIVDNISENFPLDGTFNELGEPNIDKTFRSAWEIDESLLTDGVGSNFNTIEEILND